MADQQPRAISILDLIRFSLYGKSKTDDRFGSPTFKVSAIGASLASFTCYPNSASEVEGEFINISLHLVELLPFLDTVLDGIATKNYGDYSLSRNQVTKLPNGGEKKVNGSLMIRVTADLVSVGVESPGKTFITFGLRNLAGYSVDIATDEAVGSGDGKDNIGFAVSWLKELKSVLTVTSVLMDQSSVRKLGGDNVDGTKQRVTEY